MRATLVQLNLSHMDFLDGLAVIHWSRLIIPRFTNSASPNEYKHPEILMKNHHKTTHSFTWYLPAFIPGGVISTCACIVLLSEASSSSHVILQHCASAQTLGSEGSTGPCQTSPNHEIRHDGKHALTLSTPNLSHMDFLDGPAAIHRSTTTYSCTTKAASPNELTNPEISMKNHQILHIVFFDICPLSSRAELYPLVPV